MTAQQIADQFSVYKQSILNSLKRSNINRRKDWKRASGDKSGSWRGGIRMIKGYRHLFRPGHRLSRADGWVAEHRFVMDDKIKNKQQVVHHEDENRLNNNIENLRIFENNGEHRKYHEIKEVRDSKGRFSKKMLDK